MSVYDCLHAVTDEASFLVFLGALADDRRHEVESGRSSAPPSPWGPGLNGWENGTIEAFLERAMAWGDISKDGLVHYERTENPWRRCADILHAGKIYE